MTRVLVLSYSSYGQIERMAGAVAEGAAGVEGSRRPSGQELGMARFQGRHVAGIARKLTA